jgi:zinc protease
VGSKDEEVKYTGIAHFFEHMMFKGTQKYSSTDYEKMLRENGGTNNAFTTRDYTGYYVDIPSPKLEMVMDLESDRMQNLLITKENMDSERSVIKEERRFRVENRVMGLMLEKIYDLIYTVHPYHWPVIGYMEDLDRISVEKAKQFYKTFYSPNNAVLVIAGDFKTAAAKALIEKYYGAMKSQEIHRPVVHDDPPQKTQKEATFYKDIQNDYFSISYKIPSVKSSEMPNLEILTRILGEGNSSRLYSKLVYNLQVATAVSAYVMQAADSSVWQIVVALKPTKTKAEADQILKKTKQVILSEILQARNVPVKTEEISKAQNQIIKALVDSLKTIDGRASSLALNEVELGSYKKLFTDIDDYLRVKPIDVKESAEKYLNPYQATIVIARPEKYK